MVADKHRITVRRKRLWEDALRRFKEGLPFHKPLSVTFVGEPAIDQGGPLREFLRLLVACIASNNMLFTGDETARVPTHNIIQLQNKTYQHVGEMLAVTIVHGGPAPAFFSPAVANYILYGQCDKVKATIVTIRERLEKVTYTIVIGT